MGIIGVVWLRGGALLLLFFPQRVRVERATNKLQQRLILKLAAGKILCIGFSLVVLAYGLHSRCAACLSFLHKMCL